MSVAAPAADLTQTFAIGDLQISFPESYRTVEATPQRLLLNFGKAAEHSLEVTVADWNSNAAAEGEIRGKAAKKGLRVIEFPGRLLTTDFGPVFSRDGQPFRTGYFLVSFGTRIVTMAITAPAPPQQPPAPELLDFIGRGVQQILMGFKSRDG